jgi:geranylgeranyl pyrophosphate synthase
MADVVTSARQHDARHRRAAHRDDLLRTIKEHRLLLALELRGRWTGAGTDLAAICQYAIEPAGKMLRPLLLLESAIAVGGQSRQVLPAAVGAECGHVASLIHDDIIDHDDLRRGKPSVQHAYGIDAAIVAGDTLIFDLFLGLAECRETGVPEGRIVRALTAVAKAGIDMCLGQSLESELCRSRCFDVDRYMHVAELKTAAFFRGACEIGAILGGGGAEHVASLAAYGLNIGTAFQIWDDLLAFAGGNDAGKPQTSDIRNGRLTLPVILAHRFASARDQRVIEHALSGAGEAADGLHAVQRIAEVSGALGRARQVASMKARMAQSALLSIPASDSRERLEHLCDLALERTS